jgi:hypothetical protein
METTVEQAESIGIMAKKPTKLMNRIEPHIYLETNVNF